MFNTELLNWFWSVDHYAYSDTSVDPEKGDKWTTAEKPMTGVSRSKKNGLHLRKPTTNQIESLHST